MRKKILIVDDVEFSLLYAKNLVVNRTNAEIMTASDGHKALEIIRKERPDLVLMDLFMPVMNGDECCRIVKSEPLIKKTPIIMLSSARKEEDLRKCVEAGCDDFFSKPILKIEVFFEKLRKFIDIVIREYPRIPIDAEVDYFFAGREYKGRARDISEGGILLEDSALLPIGTLINMIFTIPTTTMSIEAEGKVVRTANKAPGGNAGMGIRFTDVTLEGKKAIVAYTDKG